MNNSKEFFDNMAQNWDQICHHDESKLEAIITLAGLKENDRVLDVACGTGVLFPHILKRNISSLTGIDISEKMIEVAKSKFNDQRLTLIAGDVLNFSQKGFDKVIIYNAYPHFDDKKTLIFHINSLLNPGGRIVIAHGDSRKAINHHHQNCPAGLSHTLNSAAEEAEILKPYFYIDTLVDTPEIYILSGIKR